MNVPTRPTQEESVCPKHLRVISALSDDDTVPAGGALPRWVAFHLSRCPSCRASASEHQAVTAGLAELATEEADASLLDRANVQTRLALSQGARMTGRVAVTTEPDVAPVAHAARWWCPARMVPLAAAATIGLAIGVYALRPQPVAPSMTQTPQTARHAPPKKVEPHAVLVHDAETKNADPTAIPSEYRGDDCTGKDCVERAFVPGRGRRGKRPGAAPRIDNAPHKESTTPVPNDP